MRALTTKVLVSLVGCSLISGCALLTPKQFRAASAEREAKKSARGDKAAAAQSAATDAGRVLLDEGHPGLAIDAFRHALARGEAPGPALNGLGVAFARIGREDVAIRYFRQAVIFDPTDTRFAMNLARMTADAEAKEATRAQLAAAAAIPALPQPRAAMAAAGGETGRQATRGEIRIVTIKHDDRPAGQRLVTAAQPSARVEFANGGERKETARMVEVAPRNNGRITYVGAPPARRPAARMAAAGPR
jgi:tetratricopeptide (TPR) repeat protein